MMQQTLPGCAFCDAVPGADVGEAHTWGKDERVTHVICVDCASSRIPIPTSVTITPAIAVTSSSMRLQPSRGSVSNSATWKAHYSCVRDIVPVGQRRTGRGT